MTNKTRVVILLLLILFTVITILVNGDKSKSGSDNLGNTIDLTKMLQYGDQVENVRVTDRYGRLFDLDALKDQPMVLLFIRYNLRNIKALDDSLHKHFKYYFDKGLNFGYIMSGNYCEKPDSPGLNVFCDTESMDLFKTFKVYHHNACIILGRKHDVLLTTTRMITFFELEKILHYKEPVVFETQTN